MAGAPFVAAPEARTAPLEALLHVAATLIREAGIGTGRARARLVETQARLKREHGLTQREFCKRLGLPSRTFRSWVARPPVTPPPPILRRLHPSRRPIPSAAGSRWRFCYRKCSTWLIRLTSVSSTCH